MKWTPLGARIVAIMLLAAAPGLAHPAETLSGKVTAVEPTYLPGRVTFKMDTASSSCPAGAWITWAKPDGANNKAVYATLMLALATGKKVLVFLSEPAADCKGQYLHLLADS